MPVTTVSFNMLQHHLARCEPATTLFECCKMQAQKKWKWPCWLLGMCCIHPLLKWHICNLTISLWLSHQNNSQNLGSKSLFLHTLILLCGESVDYIFLKIPFSSWKVAFDSVIWGEYDCIMQGLHLFVSPCLQWTLSWMWESPQV